MSKTDEIPTTNPDEIEALIQKLKDGKLDKKDAQLIERLLRTFLSLISLLQKKNQSIAKLKRMLFGPKTDARTSDAKDKASSSGEDASDGEIGTTESQMQTTHPQEQQSTTEEQKKRKGHGRRSRSEYVGAERVTCSHTELKVGDTCPDTLCKGHLYDTLAPSVLVQLEGQPPVSATCYEQQVLRCSACQTRYTASLPKDVKAVKYLSSCDVAIAMWKYSAGVPFYRFRSVQSWFGIPLSESVMFERCENVADAVLPIYLHLKRMAAQGKVLYVDDSARRKPLFLWDETIPPRECFNSPE